MKRPVQPLLIALGIFAVLGILAAVLWSRFDAATSPMTPAGGSPVAMSPGSAPLTPGANGLDAAALESAADASANERTAAARLAGGTVSKIAVEGVVRAPAGGGVDDHVEVFGLARESDLDALFTAIGPKRGPDDGTVDLESASLVVSRARADASGKFRITFPEGTRKGHVIVAGRSWFMRDTVAVDLTKGDARIALQTEAGAWITASIALPAGLAASTLDGEVATLKPELAGFGGGFGGPQRGGRGGGMAAFQRSERRVAVQNGIAEFFAVDPSTGYTVEITPREFASTQSTAPELAPGRGADMSIALTRGGVVRGRVIGSAGEGIEGATVEARITGVLFGFDDRTVRRTKSGQDGSFELAAVAAGKVQVSARLKGHVDAEVQKLDVQEGAALTGIDFTLAEGTTVAGIVTWKDGQPAAEADVTVAPERGGGGFGRGGGNGGGNGGGGGGGNANGGGPGGGGQRNFGGFGGGRGSDGKAVTDAAGHFVVKGLGAGPFTVTAEALTPQDRAVAANAKPDVKRRLAYQGRVETIPAGSRDVALVVTPPIGVAGRVTDAVATTPVAKFTVKAQASGGGGGGQGGGRQGPFGGGGGGNRLSQDVDDPSGAFLLTGLREGTWKVTIAAEGYSTSDAIEISVPRKEGDAALAFALIKAASIAGIVKAPDGSPVAGATVAVPSSAGAPWMRGGGGGGAVDETPTARSDAEGHFVLEGFKPGRATIAAESKQWAKSEELAFDLVAGQKVEGAVLTMRLGATITGEVFDDNGRRAPGRTVQGTEMKAFTAASARTDGSGHFKIEHVQPGSWRLMAMPSAQDIASMDPNAGGGPGALFGRMKSVSADVAEGEEVHVVIGAPPEDPVVVRGKVTHAGEPVAGARVMFSGQGQGFGPGMKNATSAEDGTFSITVDKPGDYSASVSPSGGRMNMIEYPVTIPSGKEYALELPLPTGRISGLVRDPDGQPASGVRVSLQPQAAATAGTMFGGQVNESTTDSDGRYDLDSLRPGTFTVLVGGANFGGGGRFQAQSDATVGREVKSDLQIKEGEWKKDVDFRLHKAGSVKVEVLDEGGAAVQGASVFARNENGQLLDRVSTVRTDAKGIATYGGLAPGRISFSARKDSLSSGESTRVTMTEAGTGSVRITLTQGTTLTVTTVEGTDDTPVRASVSVFDEGGRDVSSMMGMGDMMQRMQRGGSSGSEQKFGPLAPGKYRVRATAQDGRTMEKSVTLSGTPDKKLTLAFNK